MILFLDESGDSSGFKETSSKTFNIAIVKTSDPKSLKYAVRKFCGRMIRVGWPRNVEIKASTLFGSPRNSAIPNQFKYKSNPTVLIERFLKKLTSLNIKVDYISILKSNVQPKLKNAPAFVLYNYLAGQLIKDIAPKNHLLRLYYDVKNKETKPKLNFSSYIITIAYENATESDFKIEIIPCDSNDVNGIRAVDFVSWAIHRRYEFKDDKFIKILKPLFENKKVWFYNQ